MSTPYATNGTDGPRVYEMCHKERKMGTMVERIRAVSLANLLHNINNMVTILANTGKAASGHPLVPGMM